MKTPMDRQHEKQCIPGMKPFTLWPRTWFAAAFLAALFSAIHMSQLHAGERTISVYVALADNQSQGIVPVPQAIGDGNNPESNLYWGTGDGLKGCFDKSTSWKLVSKADSGQGPHILRTRTYSNTTTNAILIARAYRGSSIRQCLQDFERAIGTNAADLVVYIGHNGLMDFALPVQESRQSQTNRTDCMVLCCKSESYFRDRLSANGGHPVLLTTQFMYPGSFILHATLEKWLKGASPAVIRESAGAAYAKNQKISLKSATGVFAEIKQ